MDGNTTNAGWVYVYVSKDGPKENFLGLFDEQQQANFIPAFNSKEDAQDCFLSIPREKGKKYEVQAVHLDELEEEASKNDFIIALVDKDGKIIK